MPPPPAKLSPELIEALRRGSIIDAIKLLRKQGIGLKDAKEMIEAHVRGQPASSSFPASSSGPPPNSVMDALKRGDKIEAVQLMRTHSGSGLKEAKNAVDALEQRTPTRPAGLSPGEVPPSGGATTWIVVLIIAGLVAYYFLSR